MLVKPAAYSDSRVSRIQWRDRAGFSPASRASLRFQHCRRAGAFLLLLALCACAVPHERHVPPAQRRVVALMPSFVEDLIALGAARQIVGVSSGTGDVPTVRRVPIVADFASVNAERIVALRPDVVLAIPAQMRFLVPLQRVGIDVETLPDDSYDDIFFDLHRIGAIVGREAQARAEIARLRQETARLRRSEPHFTTPPSVFVVIGAQPIWTVGNGSYIATLLRLAGARDAAGSLGTAYGEYSAEALLREQPDAIVTDPSTEIGSVEGREPWRSLRAVRLHRVFVIPNASLLERPGPRYVEGLAWLIRVLRRMPASSERAR